MITTVAVVCRCRVSFVHDIAEFSVGNVLCVLSLGGGVEGGACHAQFRSRRWAVGFKPYLVASLVPADTAFLV